MRPGPQREQQQAQAHQPTAGLPEQLVPRQVQGQRAESKALLPVRLARQEVPKVRPQGLEQQQAQPGASMQPRQAEQQGPRQQPVRLDRYPCSL